MKTTLLSLGLAATLWGTACAAPITSRAITAPLATPLLYPFSTNFGQIMTASPKYFVFGIPSGDSGKGLAYVYSATTGQLLKTLRPPVAEADANTSFGAQVAISGDSILIGAPGADVNAITDTGRIYVFNALTGAITTKLDLSGDSSAMNLRLGGDSLAAEGDLCVTGSTTYGGKGRAWLFNFKTGAMNLVLSPASIASGDAFGAPAAISGQLIVISAPNRQNPGDAAQGGGMVYVFDRLSGSLVNSVYPDPVGNANLGGKFGSALAVEGYRALIGSPFVNSGRGKAEMVDLRTGRVTDSYFNPDTAYANDYFGAAVALQGGLAIVSAHHWATLDEGAVYYCDATANHATPNVTRLILPTTANDALGAALALSGTNLLIAHYANNSAADQYVTWLQNVPEPLNGAIVKRTGDQMPGSRMYGATLKAFTNVAALPSGDAVFTATITRGANTRAHVSKGIWASAFGREPVLIYDDGYVGTATSTFFRTFGLPMLNQSDRVMLSYTDFGPGVTADNKLSVSIGTFAGSGDTPFYSNDELFGTNVIVGSYAQIAQSFDATYHDTAARCNLVVGKGGVTAATDTGIMHSDGVLVAREGSGSVGQLTNMSFNWRSVYYTAPQLSPEPVGSQGVFTWDRSSHVTMRLVKTGDSPGGSLPNFTSFSGITVAGYGDKVGFRSKLGTGSSALDAVFSNRVGAVQAEFVSNQTPSFISGTTTAIKTAKCLGYWLENESILMLITLKGTGITAANDTCLICAPAGGSGVTYLLLREGDPAPGGRGGRIGTISRVDAEPIGGSYLVLCTLTGAPTGEDQILYGGNFDHPSDASATTGAPDPRLRVPSVLLRKGSLVDLGLAGPVKISSITVNAPGTDAGGAGGNTVRSVGSYGASVIVGLSDGTSNVVTSYFPFSL